MKYFLIIATILLFNITQSMADDPGNPGDILGGGGSGVGAEGVPVDGFSTVLLLSGVVLAVGKLKRKATEKRKLNNSDL
jgi:hypothetical protein